MNKAKTLAIAGLLASIGAIPIFSAPASAAGSNRESVLNKAKQNPFQRFTISRGVTVIYLPPGQPDPRQWRHT